MPIDSNRATFVQQEYRYETAENLNIKVTYQSGRELTFPTNLSEASAANLASLIFAESSANSRVFKVAVEAYYPVESIATGPLRFILDLPSYATDGSVYKVVEFESDPVANRTTFVVRG